VIEHLRSKCEVLSSISTTTGGREAGWLVEVGAGQKTEHKGSVKRKRVKKTREGWKY
jgi:hypothetical protein